VGTLDHALGMLVEHLEEVAFLREELAENHGGWLVGVLAQVYPGGLKRS
jgi:hypothetical protein